MSSAFFNTNNVYLKRYAYLMITIENNIFIALARSFAFSTEANFHVFKKLRLFPYGWMLKINLKEISYNLLHRNWLLLIFYIRFNLQTFHIPNLQL